ncbi:riboflavin synthase [Oceanirhabdus sp. W0125-5]|uniref:riboflavin synthase n=1 Tax=Oceanirhabdus sp. W0125-5 TaxID=2999116 RepID=UPI0022F2DBE9|nr:riboflavin synthase [Oceanirhabdus sp. W0125-5]WBW95964.1 riboflavin synthase [Oceanirhabdus sp. W0125-5]
MFTGIIEEVGSIKKISDSGDKRSFTMECKEVLKGARKGDSISVNGVCLTINSFGEKHFVADVMNETVKASTFKWCKEGDSVNLERALCMGDRLGGHIITGHIDCVGQVKRKYRDGNAVKYEIEFPVEYISRVVNKGSIGVDGISLTIMEIRNNTFTISIIPTTSEDTIISKKNSGDWVNLEFDIIGKYVERILGNQNKSNIDMSFLKKNGFM